MKTSEARNRQPYQTPKLKEWGKVTDLTQFGETREGEDSFGGSANIDGGPPKTF